DIGGFTSPGGYSTRSVFACSAQSTNNVDADFDEPEFPHFTRINSRRVATHYGSSTFPDIGQDSHPGVTANYHASFAFATRRYSCWRGHYSSDGSFRHCGTTSNDCSGWQGASIA